MLSDDRIVSLCLWKKITHCVASPQQMKLSCIQQHSIEL